MAIALEPVGHVRGGRAQAVDDNWGDVRAMTELDDARFGAEALAELDTFRTFSFSSISMQLTPPRLSCWPATRATIRPGPKPASLPSGSRTAPITWGFPRAKF